MKKYRKKPVVIEAMCLAHDPYEEILKWVGNNGYPSEEGIEIITLEGTMTGRWSDYIIKGVRGEFYPCRYDIFKETYEEVV